MSRLLSTMKNDVVVQFRNNLYSIGIGVGVIIAAVVSQLARPMHLPRVVPTMMLLIVGSSTLLYVAGMILFERDEGTLSALAVSPLKPGEYLWSKIVTLTMLATIEAIVMIGGAMAIMRFSAEVPLPNLPFLLLGIFAIGMMYTLIGIIVVVRYETITDFLMPMAALTMVLQLPFLYFFGMVTSPLLLLIPTSAPGILMQSAYIDLPTWQLAYGVGYSLLTLAGLTFWALRAFDKHVTRRVG